MVCKTTSTKPNRAGGFTLYEMLFAVMIGSMALLIIATSASMIIHGFVSLSNYIELDRASRHALDVMSKDIRQAEALSSYNETNLTFLDGNKQTLSYSYSPESRTVTRTQNGQSEILLEECDSFLFSLFQRNPVGGTYDQYPAAEADTCKLVQLNWLCSRLNFSGPDNTEVVQSAKFVIRKQ